MADQHILHFLRIDVHAARDDHEGLAVGEIEISLRVELAHVTERRPIGMRGVSRLRRLLAVVVIFERRRASEIDRSLLADGHFSAVLAADVNFAEQRAADGSRMREPIRTSDIAEAVAFRAGIIFVNDRPPPIDHPTLDLDGTRRRRVNG